MVRPVYIILYAFLVVSVGALVENSIEEGCPEGRSIGEIWTDYDNVTCSRRTCMDGETFIESCDDALAEVAIEEGCYVKSHPGDQSAEYPGCCQEDVKLCPGDQGYREEDFMQLAGALV